MILIFVVGLTVLIFVNIREYLKFVDIRNIHNMRILDLRRMY